MRKALIASVVAAGLFAVGAFAADFALDSEDVASGSADVGACATDADVDFETDPDAVDGDFVASAATVTFVEHTPTSGDAPGSCEGQTAEIAIGVDTDDDANDEVDDYIETTCGLITGGMATCDFDPSIPVGQIEEVVVLAEELVVSEEA